MQVCKTVKLRMRDRRNGTKSLFLDFWPGYRDPETMELIRRRSLGMYIYADPANKQQKLYNDKILAKAEAIRCKVYIDVLDEKYDFFNRDRLKEDFLGYFRNIVNRNYVKCDAAISISRNSVKANVHLRCLMYFTVTSIWNISLIPKFHQEVDMLSRSLFPEIRHQPIGMCSSRS